MTLTEEIAAVLAELDVGTYHQDGTPGGTIYITTLPESPDVCLSVSLYGSGAEASVGDPWDEPRFQVRARGTREDARAGEALAQAAYDALHGLGTRYLTPGATWLQLAVCLQGGPQYIGRDEQGRHEHVVNLRAEVRRPTPNRPAE